MSHERDIRSALADVLGLIPAGHPLLDELLSVRDAAAAAPQRWCWIKVEGAVERHFGPNQPTVPWMVEMLRVWRLTGADQGGAYDGAPMETP